MSSALDRLITVLPLHGPRQKPWERNAMKKQGKVGREHVTEMVAKLEQAAGAMTSDSRRETLGKTRGTEDKVGARNEESKRQQSGHSTALQLYNKNDPLSFNKQAGALQQMSVCQACKLEKAVRNHDVGRNVQHFPPLSTLAVRWYNHGSVPCYTIEKLKEIFGHFGVVRKVSFQSLRSAHVVFESIESACAAIKLSNLHSGCPLHMRWLPEAAHNAKWTRKEAVSQCVTQLVEDVIRSPQAITRPSQICCTIHARSTPNPR